MPGSPAALNDLELNIVTALSEEAAIRKSPQWQVEEHVFRLACGLRTDQSALLEDGLEAIRKRGVLVAWSRSNGQFTFVLATEFVPTSFSPTELEKIATGRTRRILLFRLYEEYHRDGDKYAVVVLSTLSGALAITPKDILRHVTFMGRHDFVLKIPFMDGGQSTCHIEEVGIALCEDRQRLFSTYGVLELRDTLATQSNPRSVERYISENRIKALRELRNVHFDLTKLVALCKEANVAYEGDSWLSLAMLQRAILDHVPPVFGMRSFKEVANNYGGKSFRFAASRLDDSLRSIADMHLHSPIRSRESLPERNQVDFRQELDLLLAEVIVCLS